MKRSKQSQQHRRDCSRCGVCGEALRPWVVRAHSWSHPSWHCCSRPHACPGTGLCGDSAQPPCLNRTVPMYLHKPPARNLWTPRPLPRLQGSLGPPRLCQAFPGKSLLPAHVPSLRPALPHLLEAGLLPTVTLAPQGAHCPQNKPLTRPHAQPQPTPLSPPGPHSSPGCL